jgi:hypothetical protein
VSYSRFIFILICSLRCFTSRLRDFFFHLACCKCKIVTVHVINRTEFFCFSLFIFFFGGSFGLFFVFNFTFFFFFFFFGCKFKVTFDRIVTFTRVQILRFDVSSVKTMDLRFLFCEVRHHNNESRSLERRHHEATET